MTASSSLAPQLHSTLVRRTITVCLSLWVGASITTLCSDVWCDEPLAEALFDEGVNLLSQGKISEACTTFDRAVNLAGGTAIGGLLMLAECREKEGRTATAWATYRRAVAAARRSGDPREVKAQDAASRLEPTLARVRVDVAYPVTSRPDLKVHLGGSLLPREAWGVAVPVDPGPLLVDAELPGVPAWNANLVVEPAKPLYIVTIPSWVPAESVSPSTSESSAAPPPSRAPWFRPLGIAGITTAAVGVAALGTGVGVALHAQSRYTTALDTPANQCAGGSCNSTGKSAVDAARAQGNVGTAFVVGGALLSVAGGTMLAVDLFRSNPAPKAALTVRVASTGISLMGSYLSNRPGPISSATPRHFRLETECAGVPP